MINYLNSNAGAIQAFMAVILVLVTIWYAFKTNQMATIMSKQLEMTSQPYLTIDKDIILTMEQDPINPQNLAPLTHWVRFVFTIKNVSNVPLKYKAKTGFEKLKSSSDCEVILYPGQTMNNTTIDYHIDPTNPYDVKGIGLINIVYWALDTPKKKFYFKRTFKVEDSAYNIIKDEAGKYEE